MPIDEEESHKTTFITHCGAFRWICMPFGLQNAPVTLQRSLELILYAVQFKTCLGYLDDVLIFSQKLEDHIKHVNEVITLSETAGVSLKSCKCQFFRKSLDYLGHVLLPGRIVIAKDSTPVISCSELPQEMTHLGSFLCA